MTATIDKATVRRGRQNKRLGLTATSLFAVAFGMVGLAYASEPLYRLFCQITGYGGTTQVADASEPPAAIVDQYVTVEFDANVNRNLAWSFKPVQRSIKVKIGERALAFYEATNISDKPIVGTATFNVTPYRVATHFDKIDCFCFTEQVLRPGETMQMPVAFFVDPGMVKDDHAKNTKVITLSYTFFQSDDQSAAEKVTAADPAAKPIEEARAPVRPKG
jgi:cytochrome c oxidase assembly protein subunit 11